VTHEPFIIFLIRDVIENRTYFKGIVILVRMLLIEVSNNIINLKKNPKKNLNIGGGGGVQLGPLGTSATNWPILPAPGGYEDGEFGGIMIGKGN
jgi:hypothetical protein